MLRSICRVRAGVGRVLAAGVVIVALTPAAALAAPPTLTGETLSSGDPALTGTCQPSGSSSLQFRATGFPFGPYETPYPYDTGSFVETGTATVGPQPPYQGGGSFSTGELTAFAANFSIVTPDATITGTKSIGTATRATGICQQVSGDPDIGNAALYQADAPEVRYEARIVTAEGTFLDHGTAYVHVDRFTTDVGFPFANFSQTFQSDLTEPARVPGSTSECKNGGYRNFPALGFKSQGDCVAYVRSISGS